MTSHSLPVNPLGHLDGGHGGEPCSWVGHEQLEPHVPEAGVEVVSAEAVAPPAVLQPLLSHEGQTLSVQIIVKILLFIFLLLKPEGIHGVDRPRSRTMKPGM